MTREPHPIQTMLKDLRSELLLKHPDIKDKPFRISMTMDDIDEMILIFEDNDYYKRAIDTISDQVKDVQVELDRIKEIATYHYGKSETFGGAADAKQVLGCIETIEQFFGKGQFDDDGEVFE